MSGNRRGTGEKGKRGKNAGNEGLGKRLQHRNNSDRRRRRRRLHQMHRDMGGRAERAVGVAVGPIGVGVRNLHRARDHHQKHARQREEDSPRTPCATALVFLDSATHI